eukprot:TRINITY_DN297_c0_g2_i2.p1 TRINITY_DN297_c0_g2~~TRINITY_DN297_c0_g2_i2.p1  ORF type:complete len:396 (+),score=170.97 TRINITY_DN297_c0_g2_i2:78-1265(+)
MALRLAVLALVASFVAAAVAQDDVKHQFYKFAATFNKQYPTLSEREYRLSVFNASLARIAERNMKSKSAVFGINQFSDLTPAEFKKQYLMENYKPAKIDDVEITKPDTLVAPPATFDWRKQNPSAVTPVKNQEQCGSCWAFSATETLESVWVLAGNKQAILSPQQIVDCDTVDQGCNGGNPNTAYEYVMQAGGQEYEADYPYQGEDGNCNFNAADVAATIKTWKYGTSNGDEKTMQANLVSVTPLSICVDAEPWQDYTSGVMTADQCGDSVDHCVQLVGYDSSASPPYWMVRNSWDTTWGVDGYIFLEMWQNTCALTSEVTYPIAGTSTSTTSTSASATGSASNTDNEVGATGGTGSAAHVTGHVTEAAPTGSVVEEEEPQTEEYRKASAAFLAA